MAERRRIALGGQVGISCPDTTMLHPVLPDAGDAASPSQHHVSHPSPEISFLASSMLSKERMVSLMSVLPEERWDLGDRQLGVQGFPCAIPCCCYNSVKRSSHITSPPSLPSLQL